MAADPIVLSGDSGTLVGFLLLSARLLAAFQFAPPFTGAAIPVRLRIAAAVAVSAAVAPLLDVDVEPTVAGLVGGIAYQVLAGAAMGFVIQLVVAAVQAAGAIVDVMSGLGAAALWDPFTQAQASPLARLYQLLAVTALFVVDGHLLVVRGVLRTFEVAPIDGFRTEPLGPLLTEAAGQLLLAAVEIALPLLVVLAMSEVVLGLASRAAPRLNVMVLGFAVKSMVLLAALGFSAPLAFRAVPALLDRALGWSVRLLGV